MLTKVRKLFSRSKTKSGSGLAYKVTLPGQMPVILRAQNAVEVRKLAREANNLTRLPAGTTVDRID